MLQNICYSWFRFFERARSARTWKFKIKKQSTYWLLSKNPNKLRFWNGARTVVAHGGSARRQRKLVTNRFKLFSYRIAQWRPQIFGGSAALTRRIFRHSENLLFPTILTKIGNKHLIIFLIKTCKYYIKGFTSLVNLLPEILNCKLLFSPNCDIF